jgi:two-component system, OmpR family, response regulator
MRILLVEDDAMLADAIARAFTQAAHAVDLVDNGEDADRALLTTEYDIMLLDIGLPGIDGLQVLKRARMRRSTVPVLVMTARDTVEDRVGGLDLGADDYITKPFHLSELEARVRALIRRAHLAGSADLVHGRVKLDTSGRRLFCDNDPIDVSAREFAVLELLLLRAGKVVTKQQILESLYGWEDVSASNTAEVFIYRLRRKLEPCGVDIRTVRGMGYLIEKPNES